MRQSYELAYSCAYFSGQGDLPEFYYIDDISFLKPVSSGDMIKFIAHVSYSRENAQNITVTVCKLLKLGDLTETTKVFEFNVIYLLQNNVKKVVPVTWNDSNQYIEGRRRMESKFQSSS